MKKLILAWCMAMLAVLGTGCSMLSEDTMDNLKGKVVTALKTNGTAKAKDLVEQAVADGKITRAQGDLLNQAIADGAAKLETLNVKE